MGYRIFQKTAAFIEKLKYLILLFHDEKLKKVISINQSLV